MRRVSLLVVVLVVTFIGCRKSADVERRESENATAAAEAKAQELTGAELLVKDEGRQSPEDAQRAKGEVVAAFQLEQADFRARLQKNLDRLDTEILRGRQGTDRQGERRLRDLQARRDLLKGDLVSVDRSTEQDWATLRTKVERDLEAGKPGMQLLPRTEGSPGEAP